MTRQYKTNLKCGGCVAKLKPYLDSDPGIGSWTVNTDSPDKVLSVDGNNVSLQHVSELVQKAGFNVLGEIAQPESAPATPGTTTYYPLILVVSFIVGIVALAEVRAGSFDWMRAMGNFMGGFFLAFSFFKLLDVRAFADAYAGYDIVARRSRAYALAYPFIELALGIAFIAGAWPLATNIVTLVVMTVSSIGVIESLLNKRKIRCACLGSVFNLPMSTVTLVEDGAMVVMSILMLVFDANR